MKLTLHGLSVDIQTEALKEKGNPDAEQLQKMSRPILREPNKQKQKMTSKNQPQLSHSNSSLVAKN